MSSSLDEYKIITFNKKKRVVKRNFFITFVFIVLFYLASIPLGIFFLVPLLDMDTQLSIGLFIAFVSLLFVVLTLFLRHKYILAIKELNKASDPDCDPATKQELSSKIISVTQKGSLGAKAKSEKKRVRFDLYSLVEKQIESHKRKFSDDCFFFFVKGSSDLKVLACDIYQALNESSDEKKFSSLEKMEVAKSDGYERIKLLYNYILGSINETDENSRILDVMDYSFSKEYYDLMKGKESEKYIKFFYTGKHLFYRFLLDDENQSQAYSVMQYFTTRKQAEIKQGDPVVKKYINWCLSKDAKSSQFDCSQIPAETKETVDFLKGKEQTDANFSQVSTGIKL